jgi:hypothetical protein
MLWGKQKTNGCKSKQDDHGPCRSPKSPWSIRKDILLKQFLFMYNFIFFCCPSKQFHVTCKRGHHLGTQQACTCDLGVWISTACKILWHFLFKGDRTTICDHNLHTIRCYFTQELTVRTMNIYGLGVRFSKNIEIFGYFLFQGAITTK